MIKITIIYLSAFIVLSSGSVLLDTAKKLQQKAPNGTLCNVNTQRQLIECTTKPYNGTVPTGTICSYAAANALHLDTFLCYEGLSVFIGHKRKGTSNNPVRTKRFFGWVIGIAIAYTVVHVATFAAVVACSFLCPKPAQESSGYVAPEPNKPPIITCPVVKDKVAEKLQNDVIVTWLAPEATDPEGGEVQIKNEGTESGSKFGNGDHTIVYTATDDYGNKDTCSIRFKVKVFRCHQDESLTVDNGRFSCLPADMIYGTECTFSCNSGYETVSNNTTKTCEISNAKDYNGVWNPKEAIKCHKRNCSSLPDLCNGQFECPHGQEYESVCHPSCKFGYSTDVTNTLKCDGFDWIGKDSIQPCKDVQPPQFTICPKSLHAFANKDGIAIVYWNDPIAKDNSETADVCGVTTPVDIKQEEGSPSGSKFEPGYHTIRFSATDGSANSEQCTFTVTVEELKCDPLVAEDQFLLVSCPNGYSYGSICDLSCFLSYNLIGTDNVACEKDPVDDQKAIWKWSNNTETFCEKLACPALPAPAGGALTCSSALGNNICTMSCSDQYQVPKGTSSEYVCSDEQVWIQGIPPNCTDKVHPSNVIQPGEMFYYYSGDCNDAGVQDGIKNNFVEVLEKIEGSNGWKNICPKYCTVEGLTVSCGPLNGRKRRGLDKKKRVKRYTNQITINFEISSEWEFDKDLWGNDATLTSLSDVMKKEVTKGVFNYNGTMTGNMVVGWTQIICPVGQEPVYEDDGRCVGCPPGRYLHKEKCVECSKGFYQDQEYQINCTQCPIGQSTQGNGSISESECKDRCSPGEFSSTGVVPCSSCQFGQFQSLYGSTTCMSCAPLLFTTTTGSSNEYACQAMDLNFISAYSSVNLTPTTNNITSFSTGFFIKSELADNGELMIAFSNFKLFINNHVGISVAGYSLNDSQTVIPELTKWTHIAFSWEESVKEIKIYLDGQTIVSKIMLGLSSEDLHIPTGSNVQFIANMSYCSLTGYFLVARTLTDNQMGVISKTCITTMNDPVYTMNNIFNGERFGTELVHSVCDVTDECLSSPCGTNHGCVDKHDGYVCVCQNGYTGTNCEIPPDYCISNDCSNGAKCQSNFSNYMCNCLPDFTGIFCETPIVNGRWGDWTDMSQCTVSCGGGIQKRVRYCNNPSPSNNGMDCVGSNTSQTVCNTNECLVCPHFVTIYEYKNSFNCTTIADTISCHVGCQLGYTFVRDFYPLDLYMCGPDTAFEWNSKPPPCTSSSSPRRIQSLTSVQYNVDCSFENKISMELQRTLDDLQCVQNKTCGLQVTVPSCSNFNREKRSSTLDVSMQFTSEITDDSDLELDDLFTNKIVSPALLNLLTTIGDLEMSIGQLNSTDILSLNIEDQVFAPDMSTFSYNTSVSCPDGSVEEELLCAACPPGTFWSKGACVLCAVGYYQNSFEQMECKMCPDGFTTQFIASKNESDCKVPKDPEIYAGKIKNADTMVSTVIPSVIASLIAVALSIIILMRYRKYIREKKRHCGNKKTLGSVASLNMVRPDVFKTTD